MLGALTPYVGCPFFGTATVSPRSAAGYLRVSIRFTRFLEFSIMKPGISLILAAVCLQPRISVNVANHPACIHLISRCNCLRMKLSSWNCGKALVCTLKYLITDKACSESFRMVKFEEVCLRLRMSVRQVSGPVSSVIEDLTKYHVGLW